MPTTNERGAALMLSNELRKILGWTGDKAPSKARICVKVLRQTGLHCFVGMLGYCSKAAGEPGYTEMRFNVTDQQLAAGDASDTTP